MQDRDKGGSGSDRMCIDFLDNELDLCQTFLNVAEVESGDPIAAAQARMKAQQGFETVLALIGRVQDSRELDRLTCKLYRLKERIDASAIQGEY